MGASAIKNQLDRAGVALMLEGVNIRAAPKDALTDELRMLIREHKSELLQLLTEEKAARAVETPPPSQAQVIASWRAALRRLPAPVSRDGERLVEVSWAFLDSPHAAAATAIGWNDVDVWGVFDGPCAAIKLRRDAQGLVPGVAWAPWPLRLERIEENGAVLISRQKTELRHYRPMPGANLAVPWWCCTALTGE